MEKIYVSFFPYDSRHQIIGRVILREKSVIKLGDYSTFYPVYIPRVPPPKVCMYLPQSDDIDVDYICDDDYCVGHFFINCDDVAAFLGKNKNWGEIARIARHGGELYYNFFDWSATIFTKRDGE